MTRSGEPRQPGSRHTAFREGGQMHVNAENGYGFRGPGCWDPIGDTPVSPTPFTIRAGVIHSPAGSLGGAGRELGSSFQHYALVLYIARNP